MPQHPRSAGPGARRAVALWLAAGLLLASSAAANGETHRLDRARLLLDASPVPPAADDPRWEPVSLPDRWRETRPEASGFAWYHLSSPGPVQAGEGWAVLLPRVNLNAAVFVNGEPVGSGGRMREPVAHNFNRPLYFPFPSRLLDRAENRIDVRLFTYAGEVGLLGPVAIGPDGALRERYERLYFRQVRLAEIATVLSSVTVLFIGALWIGTRFDPVYGWFALASALWGVTGLNYWVRDVPVGHWAWERLVNGAIEAFVVALAFWMHRFLGLHRPRLERALMGYAALAIGAIALLPPERFYGAVGWIHATALPIGAYSAIEVARRLERFRPWEAAAYLVGGAMCLAVAANDLAIQLGWHAPDAPHLLMLMVPFMMLAFGTTLVGRFVASLGRAERLGQELERRVRAKTAELEASHRRQGELEREKLLARERERIMREMHDGLGGQLVSALATIERGSGDPEAVAAALRGALGDMRLVIDSLDPEVTGLDELLGMLRMRLEPLLRPSGLRFAWKVGDLPAPAGWGAEEYLHVLRIVQEAVTNVLKHAEASVVTLRTSHRDGALAIEVRDDGAGPGAATGGRGIASMRDRARRLGGELRVAAAEPGTVVELRVPLARG